MVFPKIKIKKRKSPNMCLVLNNLDCAVILNIRAIASSSSAELHWINTSAYFRKEKGKKLLSKLGFG